MTKRKGEPNAHFQRRIHCNTECSRTNPLLHQEQKDNYTKVREKETKVCPECGKTFSRTRNESRAVFKVKITCRRTCSDARLRKEHEKLYTTPKICTICGGKFYRRKGTETKTQFEARKTCGSVCGHESRKTKMGDPKSPNGKKRATEYEKKVKEERETKKKGTTTAPPPVPQPDVVWRPASWGGPRKREAS